ncbi:MAG: hypothetical protein A2751_04795 [Candidatus Doudnabacteria bacterium RIFCSPHIGHO2_01_FULL_46_14]|uniref:Type II secretion system protein GspG C-terminal domain-containing protein n=1 Tax=Candidatus Doudnabacteria bacterium RIFCSPHIGHO2_01_FULL_46_14 TaxID=1817824 RepID=A0A1F5NPH9_9BACT|nr:MAG: hypothetical protein A2751_04795 [Candidatus Doudnabacteria bacterium RIFCSPHIGHO2_01_FULL_46_14]
MSKLNKGFTLIELLVVISVIGLLASVILVALNSVRAKARDTKRIADLRQISTALELFYDNYGRYPRTGGSPSWEGHWLKFKTCLLTGVDCQEWAGDGSDISGYQAALSKVPDDPLNPTPDVDDNSTTYKTGWAWCNDQMYILWAQLETNHPALQSDADGDHYSAGDGGCNDPYYCVKVNWCH